LALWKGVIRALNFDEHQNEVWANTANLRRYDHPVVQAFSEQRIKCIKSLLGSYVPESALDVGCGDGFGMQAMQAIVEDIHGCDKSPKMLAENPSDDTHLKQCDAYDLPYENNAFDFVYCWELLHHIGEPQKVVQEMARVTSRCVLLCEPNSLNPAMALFGLLYPHERGLLRFTPSYPDALLRGAGFQKTVRRTVGWFTPNRTPESMAKVLSKLPYHLPLLGLYTITLAFKEAD
jgi:ubiquinone/menaquinone biosynthesis C-methylase UbiE